MCLKGYFRLISFSLSVAIICNNNSSTILACNPKVFQFLIYVLNLLRRSSVIFNVLNVI